MPYIYNNYNFIEDNTAAHTVYYYATKLKQIPKGTIKIEIPIENKFPRMHISDWAFSVKYDDHINDKRHMRLPTYTRLGAGKDLIKDDAYDPQKIMKEKTKFCAFIYWNGSVKFRNKFFHALSKYKRVDSPGRACNNMPPIGGHKNWNQVYAHIHGANAGKRDIEKINFLRKYKFCIAFANESSPGYTSEKIYHAMLANCIPIYWGNPLVHRDFNTKSFANYHDHKSIDALIDCIIKLDKDDDAYLTCLKQPWLPNNKLTPWLTPSNYTKRFKEIFGK
jgi:hypothetical protein